MEIQQIILFFVLFSLSAFFSGTEIALMSIPHHKIDALVKNGRWWSKALKYIKQNNDKLLVSILIGNNLVNVYISAIATQMTIWFAKNSWIEESLAIWIATWIITFMLLMFGDVIPKSYATKNAEKIALSTAAIYKVLLIIFAPIIFFVEWFIKAFAGKAHHTVHITDEELEVFIDMAKASGTIDDGEHERIQNLRELGEMMVEDIMTPRVNIEGISDDMTVKEALEYYMAHTKSRLPVYRETPDKIHSILTIRDLLVAINEGKEETQISKLVLSNALKVPLNQWVDKLFEVFQKSHRHIAIVLDEYGGVAGLITLEDIIEEVFWDIRDETDREHDDIKKIGENMLMIDSSAIIDDVLEEFDLELPHLHIDERDFSTETVSYILTDKLERFPNENEELEFLVYKNEDDRDAITWKLTFKILWIKEGRIGKIEVSYNLVEKEENTTK